MKRLFVYGSLQPQAEYSPGYALARELAGVSQMLGRARTRGHLLDLGEYPGLVPAAEKVGTDHASARIAAEGPWVYGRLLELPTAPLGPSTIEASTSIWARLDLYEDCDPAHPATCTYQRARILCEGAWGQAEAWSYVFMRAGDANYPRVVGGDWLARATG